MINREHINNAEGNPFRNSGVKIARLTAAVPLDLRSTIAVDNIQNKMMKCSTRIRE